MGRARLRSSSHNATLWAPGAQNRKPVTPSSRASAPNGMLRARRRASAMVSRSQVRERLARVRILAEPALQDLSGQPPPPEAKGQSQSQDQPTERDAEGD